MGGYLDWFLRLADPIARAHGESPQTRPAGAPPRSPRLPHMAAPRVSYGAIAAQEGEVSEAPTTAPQHAAPGDEPSAFPFPFRSSQPRRPGDLGDQMAGRAQQRPSVPLELSGNWAPPPRDLSPHIPGESEQTAPLFPFPNAPRVRVDTSEVRPTQRAARAVGVPAPFLGDLVGHESGGDKNASNPLSSATGHGQFTEQTWLAMVRANAARYGHTDLAEAIQQKPGGALFIEDPQQRAEILQLRTDPQWSALMSAHYARQNTEEMQRALGRPITEREAYLGHFLGSGDAIELLQAAERNQPDARRFVSPGAVESNPQIFYEGGRYEARTNERGQRYRHYVGGGRPRSAREVAQLQGRNFRGDQIELAPQPQSAVRDPRAGPSPRTQF